MVALLPKESRKVKVEHQHRAHNVIREGFVVNARGRRDSDLRAERAQVVDTRRVALHPLDRGRGVEQKLSWERRADLAREHDRGLEPAHDGTERFVARARFERETGIAGADRRPVDVGLHAQERERAARSQPSCHELALLELGAAPSFGSRQFSSGPGAASHTSLYRR